VFTVKPCWMTHSASCICVSTVLSFSFLSSFIFASHNKMLLIKISIYKSHNKSHLTNNIVPKFWGIVQRGVTVCIKLFYYCWFEAIIFCLNFSLKHNVVVLFICHKYTSRNFLGLCFMVEALLTMFTLTTINFPPTKTKRRLI